MLLSSRKVLVLEDPRGAIFKSLSLSSSLSLKSLTTTLENTENSQFWCFAGQNSADFTVGLTNVHPLANNPQLGSYDLCGQYPGIVPQGATVKLKCDDPDLPPARYVIVLFRVNLRIHFCEVEVYTPEGWIH